MSLRVLELQYLIIIVTMMWKLFQALWTGQCTAV